VILLWHGEEPVGICVFGTGAASLSLRTKYFGLTNPRSKLGLQALNEQLWLLQRVVLHPIYRGAGIAAEFVRRACELCPVPWIETLSAMGRVNPFFERAGFVRVGMIDKRSSQGGAYTKQRRTKHDAYRFSEPVYYVRDNRSRV
jgi:GNAT superfamily N-acetyltransferase